jgi:hypothetical protein
MPSDSRLASARSGHELAVCGRALADWPSGAAPDDDVPVVALDDAAA